MDFPCVPRDDSSLSSQRIPAVPGTPRPETDDGTKQVSWLPGLRFSSAFPRGSPSVAVGRRLAGYSCGGSHGYFTCVP